MDKRIGERFDGVVGFVLSDRFTEAADVRRRRVDLDREVGSVFGVEVVEADWKVLCE